MYSHRQKKVTFLPSGIVTHYSLFKNFKRLIVPTEKEIIKLKIETEHKGWDF